MVDSNVTEELQVVKPVVKRQYKHISFVPDKEQTKDFIKGIEREKVNDVFGNSMINDDSLDDFFSDIDLPF